MSLMSASYPGGYYTNPGIGWRGASSSARVMTRVPAVPRDSREMGPPPAAMQAIPTNQHLLPSNPPTYMDVQTPFVTSTPSHEAQVFRYVNTAVANLTLGTSKQLQDESSMMLPPSASHLDKKYDQMVRNKGEETYASSAVTIPGSDNGLAPAWKKVSSTNGQGNTNSSQNAGAAIPSGSPSKRSSLDIEKEINGQNLYKTELCRSFVETGMCRYGSKCQFAHGQSELRPVLRHPKYKTDFCKTFHTIGTCPYGTRCRFIHKRSEVEIGQNSIFLPPNANSPEWGSPVWKDPSDAAAKPGAYGQVDHEKKPRSLSMKERRKSDNQQLKMEKHKLQRVIGRQRSNTDSPPPPLRRKAPGAPKIPGPLGGKHDVPPESKGHRRRKSTGNSESGDPAATEAHPPVSAGVGSDMDTRGLEHLHNTVISPAVINHGHMNGGVGIPHPLGPGLPGVMPLPVASGEFLGPPAEDALLLPVLQDPVEVEAPIKEKVRRRSSSSASRLPIFQELCTASEEEIAISLGATASTVVHRVLSSSS